ADMSGLDTQALARECASPLFWRRQTAQRLLVERGGNPLIPAFFPDGGEGARRAVEGEVHGANVLQEAKKILRELLADKNAEASAVIIALRALDQLGAHTPADVRPFIGHADAAVRIHALQLADRWFAKDEGRALLDATLTAAAAEPNPRVQIQFALSLGEARDPRAFAMLARFARERLGVRWMDAAVLSCLHG